MTITINTDKLENIKKIEVSVDFYKKLFKISEKYGFNGSYKAIIKSGLTTIEINSKDNFITYLTQNTDVIDDIDVKFYSDDMYFSIRFGKNNNFMYMSTKDVVNANKFTTEVKSLISGSQSNKMIVGNFIDMVLLQKPWYGAFLFGATGALLSLFLSFPFPLLITLVSFLGMLGYTLYINKYIFKNLSKK
jgi:hypothetical protein